jgi:putative transposase
MDMKTESLSHCHGESSFHVVFCPKYRHEIFSNENIKAFCKQVFGEIAERYGFEIRALRIMADHVHIFVLISPRFSVSQVVQYFKGYSARRIFEEYPWLKEYKPGEKRFWGGHLWSRGYFFRSVGSTTDEAVEFYIKVTQDRRLREKYYTGAGSSRRGGAAVEDPYIEHLKGRLWRRRPDEKQKALDEFMAA